jgi:hypothetical protein
MDAAGKNMCCAQLTLTEFCSTPFPRRKHIPRRNNDEAPSNPLHVSDPVASNNLGFGGAQLIITTPDSSSLDLGSHKASVGTASGASPNPWFTPPTHFLTSGSQTSTMALQFQSRI